jgi:hypothetical protein
MHIEIYILIQLDLYNFDNQMELLKDPENSRIVKSLPLPSHRPLKSELIFQGNIINVALVKDFLRK